MLSNQATCCVGGLSEIKYNDSSIYFVIFLIGNSTSVSYNDKPQNIEERGRERNRKGKEKRRKRGRGRGG